VPLSRCRTSSASFGKCSHKSERPDGVLSEEHRLATAPAGPSSARLPMLRLAFYCDQTKDLLFERGAAIGLADTHSTWLQCAQALGRGILAATHACTAHKRTPALVARARCVKRLRPRNAWLRPWCFIVKTASLACCPDCHLQDVSPLGAAPRPPGYLKLCARLLHLSDELGVEEVAQTRHERYGSSLFMPSTSSYTASATIGGNDASARHFRARIDSRASAGPARAKPRQRRPLSSNQLTSGTN
jgi:hypothetical protein